MGSEFWFFLGDIKESRNIDNRQDVQRKLVEIFENLNKEYRDQLVANVGVTRGDEFGCAGRNPVILNEIGDEIWWRTSEIPVKRGGKINTFQFRYAIVKGEISTFIGREIGAMDGPVFQVLDEKIKELKREKYGWVYFEGFGNIEDSVLTSFKNLIYSEFSAWSFSERKIVSLFHKFKNQNKVAEKIGVTQPYISRVLKNTSLELIEKAIKDFNMLLKFITETGYKM